jgi:alpha-ketoglutarate-dependent taurine dioxygenase
MSFPIVTDEKVDFTALKKIVDNTGALVVRNFKVNNIEEFALFASMFGDTNVDMSCSAGPRIDMGHNVFTANEAPPDKKIPVHHEMAQCEKFPSYVLFYCQHPPSEGGCTPIIRSSVVAQQFKNTYPEIYNRLRKEGVRY